MWVKIAGQWSTEFLNSFLLLEEKLAQILQETNFSVEHLSTKYQKDGNYDYNCMDDFELAIRYLLRFSFSEIQILW